ncbi:type IV secretory system conjugative DNA transfer family protein [Desulforamulus hydrothermalis]|uniref:type IV secretory system conjugative DNA transfer family protein n=1 Tax=Desulforamulus hydrothermalis TaxID=412895 RepID=UPI000911C748|nr:TraM recognition domain-containing protein [Desulforamulus hydrothermalis]SHG73079.1 Type IV secretory pathway, VirD4 component, TraG/TraD family ATPase [Desulforamulus hydrothermalis Lam5 = DSM 18033]
MKSITRFTLKFNNPKLNAITAITKECLYFAVLPLLIGVFILDIWLLGTLAAWLVAAGKWAAGMSLLATPEQKEAAKHALNMVGWYFHHPVSTAWAWLTRPNAELSQPGVRVMWLILNLVMCAGGIAWWMWWKIGYGKKHQAAQDGRDIEKIKFERVNFKATDFINRTPKDQIFLGLDDRRRPVILPVKSLTEHIHIIGGSGSGKTSLAVLPLCIQAFRRGMSVVCVDFKGDEQAIKLLAREARAAGKRFYFFTLHPEISSNTYNPLQHGTALSKVERIMTALELVFEGQAKFYTYVQQSFFIPIVKALDTQGALYTLEGIARILSSEALVASLLGIDEKDVNKNHLKGLTAALEPFTDLKIINQPAADINLRQIMEEGDICYFDLRSAVAPSIASALGKMIAMELQELAAYRTPASRLAMIAIDEFQNMACQAFENVISKVRSANYALVLANQARGNLEKVSPAFTNEVATNTATKIIFHVDDPKDVQDFSARAGTVLVKAKTESTSTSKPGGRLISFGSHSSGESVHEEEVPRIHPNVFLSLPERKSVIFRRRQQATLTNHAHILTREEKEQLEAEPWPEPVRVNKFPAGITVSEIIEAEKRKIIERQLAKKREEEAARKAADEQAAEGLQQEEIEL